MDAAPCRRAADGRLAVEDVLLVDVAAQLDGRAAVVLSEEAVRAAARASGPRTIDAGAVHDDALAEVLVDEGWWLRLRSSHDVERAVRAGVPVGRRVAGGGVRDDGFLKDALAAGVAAIEHDDRTERDNAERVAAILGGAWPDGDVAPPPDARPDAFAEVAVLVAGVLRDGDPLRLDAPCPRRSTVAASLEPHDDLLRSARLAGLGPIRDDLPASTILGPTPRGAWLAVPVPDGLTPPRADPSFPPPERVLVRGALWRFLPAPRPPHAEAHDG